MPPADVYGVATFYALFSVEQRPPRVVHVCDDIACRCAGSRGADRRARGALGPEGSDVDGACWLRSPCLGQCDRAPAALLTEAGDDAARARADARRRRRRHRRSLDGGDAARSRRSTDAAPGRATRGLRLLRRVGPVDPESLDDYRAHGGYDALRRAIELGPSGVIREVTDSGLVGRGGAAFPTGRKWDAVRAPAARARTTWSATPTSPSRARSRTACSWRAIRSPSIEAMTIAGYATGCEQRLPLHPRRVPARARRASSTRSTQARERGFLGRDVLGHGFAFDIEVRKGAGAYICGEETALFNSIEGYRGEPRNKPPFPVVRGLFGQPTVVNNVETLVNVLPIVLEGGPAFAAIGTEQSTGPEAVLRRRARSSARACTRSPFGTTLRELLELAGGVAAPNLRPCCSAARPAGSSRPTSSTCR